MKTLFIFLLAMAEIFSSRAKEPELVKISNGEVTVAVDLAVGGRVMEYSLNGNNAIFIGPEYFESSSDPDGGRCDFGPEPITPAHPETWKGSWELIKKKQNYLKIKSQVAKAAGVQLIREFKLDENSSHLKFTQHIINVSDSLQRYCHWGRTFGEKNGICLAPLNPNSRFPKGYMVYAGEKKLDYSPKEGKNERVREGILEITGPPENAKFVTDASDGWLAYITQDDQLFVKKFEIFPEKIYGEMTAATVSIWYNQDGICEIEPIGPWEWIKPGKSISFTENWYLMDYEYPKDKKADLNEVQKIIEEL